MNIMKKCFPALLLLLLAAFLATAHAATSSYGGGHFSLELNGSFVGWLQSVGGGHATSGVVQEKFGSDRFVRKQIGGAKYDAVTLKFAPELLMSQRFFPWLRDSLANRTPRMDGALSACDFAGKERQRREFMHALISEVVFPALDARSGKEEAFLTVRITPEYTRYAPGTGKVMAGYGKTAGKVLCNSFRLTIAGLNTDRVSRIEALDVKLGVGKGQGILTVEMPKADAKALLGWADAVFHKQGGGREVLKKNGYLVLRDVQGRPVYTLSLGGLLVSRVMSSPLEAGNDKTPMITAAMTVDHVAISR